jgi:hypothetical protein
MNPTVWLCLNKINWKSYNLWNYHGNPKYSTCTTIKIRGNLKSCYLRVSELVSVFVLVLISCLKSEDICKWTVCFRQLPVRWTMNCLFQTLTCTMNNELFVSDTYLYDEQWTVCFRQLPVRWTMNCLFQTITCTMNNELFVSDTYLYDEQWTVCFRHLLVW